MDTKRAQSLMMDYLLMFNHRMTHEHEWRVSGALEALLYVVGKLTLGERYPYQTKECYADGLFGIGKGPYTKIETHIQMTKRLATEYLKETNV